MSIVAFASHCLDVLSPVSFKSTLFKGLTL